MADLKFSKKQLPALDKNDVGLGNVENVAVNNMAPSFTEAGSRTNVTSGSTLSVLFGMIAKWFTDLKAVAFSGSYNDLADKPASLPASGGNADTAAKLSTARTIGISGGATGTATSFDGSANIDIPVTSLDATKLSGMVPLLSIPKAALADHVIVADDTARFALTTVQVQNGDIVEVTATGKMYFVKDDTKLNLEDGYGQYTAGTASSVPWGGITGKPSAFTPEAHTHTPAEAGLGNVPNVTTENQTPAFTEAGSRVNIASGETIATLFGKIMKWLSDLKTVAFTGSYNDLADKPSIGASWGVYEMDLSAQCNGANLAFTLTEALPGYFAVYWNGQRLQKTTNYTYTAGTTTLTLTTTAPETGNVLVVEYAK